MKLMVGDGTTQSSQGHIVSQSSVMKVNKESGAPEPVALTEPLPRINASVIVRSNILYIYGGLLEVGDREVTLDDMWSLNLEKTRKMGVSLVKERCTSKSGEGLRSMTTIATSVLMWVVMMTTTMK